MDVGVSYQPKTEGFTTLDSESEHEELEDCFLCTMSDTYKNLLEICTTSYLPNKECTGQCWDESDAMHSFCMSIMNFVCNHDDLNWKNYDTFMTNLRLSFSRTEYSEIFMKIMSLMSEFAMDPVVCFLRKVVEEKCISFGWLKDWLDSSKRKEPYEKSQMKSWIRNLNHIFSKTSNIVTFINAVGILYHLYDGLESPPFLKKYFEQLFLIFEDKSIQGENTNIYFKNAALKYLQIRGKKSILRPIILQKKFFVCSEGKHEVEFDKTVYYSSFLKETTLLVEDESILCRIILELENWENNILTCGPWELHFNTKEELEDFRALQSEEVFEPIELEKDAGTKPEVEQEEAKVTEIEIPFEFEIEMNKVSQYFKIGKKGTLELDTATCGRELRTYLRCPCKVVITQRYIPTKNTKHFALCAGSCKMCQAKFKYFFENNPFDIENEKVVDNLKVKGFVRGRFLNGDVTRPDHDNVKPEGEQNITFLK